MTISCITCLHGLRRHSCTVSSVLLEIKVKTNAAKYKVKRKGGTNMVKRVGRVICLHASVV